MTHTYSILHVPAPIYAEIKRLLLDAGYSHVIHKALGGEVIDMHGVALSTDETETPSFIGWSPCDYKTEGERRMPEQGHSVLIRVNLTPGINYFLAHYAGNGQFRIETKAELQHDGSHLKLTSSMAAEFVTHWVYITEPR